MKGLFKNEIIQIIGTLIPLVIVGIKLGVAIYRHNKLATAVSWATRGSAIVTGTYEGMAQLDEFCSID
jgi:hypothetical protein